MTAPAEIIAALDASLAEHGEAVTLRRRIGTGATFVDLAIRASIRGYKAEQLVGSIKQTDQQFIFSPSEIAAASATWPGAAGGGADPTTNDFLVVAGRQRKIEHVAPTRVGGAVVRYEGRVLG